MGKEFVFKLLKETIVFSFGVFVAFIVSQNLNGKLFEDFLITNKVHFYIARNVLFLLLLQTL